MMGITYMIFSCVCFGKAHLFYIIMIMQVRKCPCQRSAGQVLVNGMPSGVLTWMLKYVDVNASCYPHSVHHCPQYNLVDQLYLASFFLFVGKIDATYEKIIGKTQESCG